MVIPSTVQEIADDAFGECAGLTASVRNNEYAEEWCRDHGVTLADRLEFVTDLLTEDGLIVIPSDSKVGAQIGITVDCMEEWTLTMEHLPGTTDWFTASGTSGFGEGTVTVQLTAVPGTEKNINNRDNYATRLTLTTESGRQITAILVIYKSGPFVNTHLNTGDQAQDLISVALTQVGYVGSNSPYDEDGILDPGNKRDDYTKYCRFLDIPGNPWCASFVSWCAFQAGIPTTVITRRTSAFPDYMSPHVKNGRIPVHYFNKPGEKQLPRYSYLLRYGIYELRENSDPKPGDLIFFRGPTCISEKAFEHIGMVISSDATTVTFIDGNGEDNSNEVKVRTIPKTDRTFAGYFSPWID